MEFVLVGQPNCGKSTIFNSVVGYKSVTSNLPGVTVQYTRGEIEIEKEKITVTDIPGTYSLTTTDEAENEAVQYLLHLPDDTVIVNVLDASVMSRSLELTLQLMEFQRPMVVALNMMDEADRKGIDISVRELENMLGVPVIPSIGTRGTGVADIFQNAYEAMKQNIIPSVLHGPEILENCVQAIEKMVEKSLPDPDWDTRFLAIKIIEKDELIESLVKEGMKKSDWKSIRERIAKYEKKIHNELENVISSFRHNKAFEIFEKSSRVTKEQGVDIRIRIDNVLMHPVFGYLFMALILYSTFWAIFSFAELIEPFFTTLSERLIDIAGILTGTDSLIFPIIKGATEGFFGGIAIAVPYLLPFFILLAILEDTGYLSRIAYLIDNLMHKIGLHGMSVVPIILGYGCNVPAILATRIMKSPRDRFITATLATLVPCSARMIIIFGLVGAVFSLKAALMIYVLNIVILGVTGKIMSRVMPVVTPGLLMEIPKYHMPGAVVVFKKTWYRLQEFVYMAWPLLIAGSIVLELIHHFKLTPVIDNAMAPFTSGVLGLPAAVGVVLIFGIMRKELALLLLTSALGISNTSQILQVMTPAQVYGFTVFTTFYIPCLATFAVLMKEFNLKRALLLSALTFGIAIILTVIFRFTIPLFY